MITDWAELETIWTKESFGSEDSKINKYTYTIRCVVYVYKLSSIYQIICGLHKKDKYVGQNRDIYIVILLSEMSFFV